MVVQESLDLLLEFWDPPPISGMAEALNFKYGMQNDHKEYSPNMLLRTTNAASRVV